MILHYKDYEGSVEYDCEDGVFYGKVTNINDLVTFVGVNWEGFVYNFMCSVDEYEDWIQ